jgi:hypothetical protein
MLSLHVRRFALACALLAATASHAAAQGRSDGGWNVGIYPVFIWVPVSIDLEVELPPDSGGDAGRIIDSRFDGAYMGGFYASKNRFRTDMSVVWTAVGGDRPQAPTLSVDVDLIYFHATGGVEMVPGLYATGGVRRFALKYNVRVADFPEFERKPGIWDPVVGVGYHYEGRGRPLELHTTFEVGGFGVGTDVEYAGGLRIDWKPISHFGLTGGYQFLHFRLENTLADRTFKVQQTIHGPTVGIGLYF